MKWNYRYFEQGSFGTGIIQEEKGSVEAHTPKSLKHIITQRLLYLRRGNWNAWETLPNGNARETKEI